MEAGVRGPLQCHVTGGQSAHLCSHLLRRGRRTDMKSLLQALPALRLPTQGQQCAAFGSGGGRRCFFKTFFILFMSSAPGQ